MGKRIAEDRRAMRDAGCMTVGAVSARCRVGRAGRVDLRCAQKRQDGVIAIRALADEGNEQLAKAPKSVQESVKKLVGSNKMSGFGTEKTYVGCSFCSMASLRSCCATSW
jgi:hypothetical protein